MKQIFTLVIALVAFSGVSFAQEEGPGQGPGPDPKKEEKIKALEVVFISRKLELTTEEAQKFWPVYNEYKKDMRQVMMSQRNNPGKDVVDIEQSMLDIRKKYRDRFTTIIGQPRMNKFFHAEHEFREVLLNQLKNHPNRPIRNQGPRN